MEYLRRKQVYLQEIAELKNDIARDQRVIAELREQLSAAKDQEGAIYSQFIVKT